MHQTEGNKGGIATAVASAHTRTGEMATTSSERLLCVPCGSDQYRKHSRIPSPCCRPLATGAQASQSKGSHHMGTYCAHSFRLVAHPTNPSSLAECTLSRQTPEVGARCVNRARRDLCGGYSVRGIPTAIMTFGPMCSNYLRNYHQYPLLSQFELVCIRHSHNSLHFAD